MNKLRNSLITLGILGIVGSVGYGLKIVKELKHIDFETPYKKVSELNSKIHRIKYTRISDILDDPMLLKHYYSSKTLIKIY